MKSYNALLLCTVCLIVGTCAGIVLWSQPITGDLTRIGAYPERWFGRNEPQQQFTNMGNTSRQPGKRHLLVLGDSFSRSGRWQAALSDRYTFTYLMLKKTRLEQLPAYLASHQPDAVVIQSVERFFPEIFGIESVFISQLTGDCQMPASTSPTRTVRPDTLSGPVFPLAARKTLPASGQEISQGYHLLRRWLNFRQHPEQRKPVILSMLDNELLSHQRQGQLLVIRDDLLLKPPLPPTEINTIRCSLQQTATALAALQIPYAIILTPDKTTAYQPYLSDDAIRARQPTLDIIAPENIPHTINMLPAVRQALADGTRDLYLPNDSHWGHHGFRLAAALIDGELQSQWPATATPRQDQP